MKEFLKKFGELLKTNWYLKVLALVFAIIVWFFVMVQTNPSRDKTVKDVGVIFQNVQYLTDKKLTAVGDLSSLLDNVQVTVHAAQSELSYIDNTNVSAVVDFSQINSAGDAYIAVQATTKYGTVLQVEPSVVTVPIDELTTRNIPVSVAQTGTQTQGYYYSRPELTPAAIAITGAQRNVERVVRASCTVDYTGVISDISRSIQVTLYDESGEEVPSSLFADIPACIVSSTVLPVEELPVDAQSSLTGVAALPPGYEVKEVSVLPDTVQVAASAAILNAVSFAFTEPIDLSGLSDTVTVNAALKSIPGVTFITDPRVKVTVTIGAIIEQRVVNLPVEVRNAESRREFALSREEAAVTLTGAQLALAAIDPETLTAYVDVSGLGVGEHRLTVGVAGLPAGITAVCEPDSIAVTIS